MPTSSSETAMANMKLAIIPGLMMGKVILWNVSISLAPRFIDASSSDMSNPNIVAVIVLREYGKVKSKCPMIRLRNDAPKFITLKKYNNATPSTTEGVERGAVKSDVSAPFPGNRNLTKAIEHGIASATANIAETIARLKLTTMPLMKSGLVKKNWYHFRETPVMGKRSTTPGSSDISRSIASGAHK